MIFQRAEPPEPVRRPRPQPRRGAFALEPADALPRLSERISRLAGRALEANPFFLPEFLEPAIQALGRRRVKLAVFSDREDLRFFAPVVTSRRRLVSGPEISIWTHGYAPLGAPLIERDMAEQVAEGIMEHMRTSGRRLFSVPHLPLAGPAAEALRHGVADRGFWTEAARQQRPILQPGGNAGLATFDAMVAPKRRKELERQLRRLSEAGSVSFMSARTASEVEAAFSMFSALEASGWKGRSGTALQRRRSIHQFARSAVLQLSQKGQAAIDVLRLGDQPVAALIRLEHGGLSIPWKIAYDEEFAAYSPGKQLMCDVTRRWLMDPDIHRVDPVCEEDNPLMTGLWAEREPYGTLLISARRWGLNARVRAGATNLKAACRQQAKALIARGRRLPKRQPAKQA